MATIELSTALTNDLAAQVWAGVVLNTGIAGQGAANSMLGYNNNFSSSLIGAYIMKGTVPTDFTTLTSFNSRVNDILVPFKVSNYDFASSSHQNDIFTMNTSLKPATATGTATWFWIVQAAAASSALEQQVFGTIGTIGSGADLEVSSTSVVIGAPYRISNLKFKMPSSWTV